MSNYPAASYSTLNSAILPSARTRLICLNPLSFVVYGGLSGSENGLDTVFNNSDIRHIVGRAMRAKEYWVLHDDPIQFPVTWDSVNTRDIPESLVGTPIARRTTGFVHTKICSEVLYQIVAQCGQALFELKEITREQPPLDEQKDVVDETICKFIDEHQPAFKVVSPHSMHTYYAARGATQRDEENAVLHCVLDICLERGGAFPGARTNFFPLPLKDALGSLLGASGEVRDVLDTIIRAFPSVADSLVVDPNPPTPPRPVNETEWLADEWDSESDGHREGDTEPDHEMRATPALGLQVQGSEHYREPVVEEDSDEEDLARAYVPRLVPFQQWEDEQYATSNALCADGYSGSD